MNTRNETLELAITRLGGPTALARAVGVSPQAVHGWRHFGRVRSLARARTVARLADVSLLALLGEPRDDQRTPAPAEPAGTPTRHVVSV